MKERSRILDACTSQFHINDERSELNNRCCCKPIEKPFKTFLRQANTEEQPEDIHLTRYRTPVPIYSCQGASIDILEK